MIHFIQYLILTVPSAVMLFWKKNTVLILSVVLLLSSCAVLNGKIMILEDKNGRGFTMDFQEYSATSTCELSLEDGDVLQVEVTRTSGKIAFSVNGKSGSEPYTGNDLPTGIFTVTVSETDEYVFEITGDQASGSIIVKNLGS